MCFPIPYLFVFGLCEFHLDFFYVGMYPLVNYA